ncbi:hypothetical protein CALCODRAFT_19134 [Calocera cornea HHB12733]|uniref:Proteasome assembly chaperone 1 n=1 Tax=Calocera cornea HHB12733 TaxID=1353952 RepID=A0A165E7D7_9BASI|nr:hypothetical protein CALCODRAFT_19134 [Calocera cornea HHB12733]
MDIEPLLDSHAPRYAVESDSEDEFEAPSAAAGISPPHGVDIALPAGLKAVSKLLIVSGLAGLEWSRGVQLSNAVGDVLVASFPVGAVYVTEDGGAIVHITCTLPPNACYPLASVIVSTFRPQRVGLLDAYTAPTYISDLPSSPYEAPIRVLCTSEMAEPCPVKAAPFRPPNLIQLFPAAVMSVLEIVGARGAAVLLPSLHISAPPGLEPAPLNDSDSSWPVQSMMTAHTYLYDLLGSTHKDWVPHARVHMASKSGRSARSTRGDVVGEGSMYI